jgi:ABC-type cobalamin transport system permease subunit
VLARLFIVIVIGAVLAVGGSVLTAVYLSGSTSGSPANAPLYNYGTG